MALWVLIRIASPILMSTHNIGFYEDLTKIIFQLSSNTHLISSSDDYNLCSSELELGSKLCDILLLFLSCIGDLLM